LYIITVFTIKESLSCRASAFTFFIPVIQVAMPFSGKSKKKIAKKMSLSQS
jgi:hypothetical protein